MTRQYRKREIGNFGWGGIDSLVSDLYDCWSEANLLALEVLPMAVAIPNDLEDWEGPTLDDPRTAVQVCGWVQDECGKRFNDPQLSFWINRLDGQGVHESTTQMPLVVLMEESGGRLVVCTNDYQAATVVRVSFVRYQGRLGLLFYTDEKPEQFGG